MRFGLSLPHFRQVASPEVIRQVAQIAEHLGYDGIWVSDHLVMPDSAVSLGDGWYPTRPLVGDVRLGVAYVRELCAQRGRDPQTLEIAVRLPLTFYDAAEASVRRRPLLGTTQQIIDDIGHYGDAGVRYMMLDTFYSVPELEHQTVEGMLATIERFADDVMPKVQC